MSFAVLHLISSNFWGKNYTTAFDSNITNGRYCLSNMTVSVVKLLIKVFSLSDMTVSMS